MSLITYFLDSDRVPRKKKKMFQNRESCKIPNSVFYYIISTQIFYVKNTVHMMMSNQHVTDSSLKVLCTFMPVGLTNCWNSSCWKTFKSESATVSFVGNFPSETAPLLMLASHSYLISMCFDVLLWILFSKIAMHAWLYSLIQWLEPSPKVLYIQRSFSIHRYSLAANDNAIQSASAGLRANTSRFTPRH